MSKGLEALKEIIKYGAVIDDDCIIIEKELKALEIIRKGIHCGWVQRSEDLEDYNSHIPMCEELSQEEYDLLKEVLL